ncbi:MAG TPA: hypothetical protein PK573_06120 [Spirochaetota bacterium]|nr:hypothetical protein [Spirochaetota bacterium]HRZ26687.1 hypothetical protein [Spirochaetota bacterium]HSA15430.1 hypothetical protein [Spirochaetota bacterium]
MLDKTKERALIIDSIRDVLDVDKLNDRDLLTVTLYRCLDLYYREHGEEGLERILRMWDDISHNKSR